MAIHALTDGPRSYTILEVDLCHRVLNDTHTLSVQCSSTHARKLIQSHIYSAHSLLSHCLGLTLLRPASSHRPHPHPDPPSSHLCLYLCLGLPPPSLSLCFVICPLSGQELRVILNSYHQAKCHRPDHEHECKDWSTHDARSLVLRGHIDCQPPGPLVESTGISRPAHPLCMSRHCLSELYVGLGLRRLAFAGGRLTLAPRDTEPLVATTQLCLPVLLSQPLLCFLLTGSNTMGAP